MDSPVATSTQGPKQENGPPSGSSLVSSPTPAPRKYGFQKGQSGYPQGKQPGTKHILTVWRVKHLEETGMTPLEFFAFCFWDQLYDKYERYQKDPRSDKWFWRKTKDAAHLTVPLAIRMQCALYAASYWHVKMPTLSYIELNQTLNQQGGVNPDGLQNLNETEIRTLIELHKKMNQGNVLEVERDMDGDGYHIPIPPTPAGHGSQVTAP